MSLPIEFVKFKKRQERSKYVAQKFAKYFKKTLLDVGCYQAPLRTLLKDIQYVGVDIAGDPDIKLDLNRADRLPFENCQFDTVISIETLEHIDNLHGLFSECVRVSRHYLIVSLPNCWRDARLPIERGSGEFAHYGLPVEYPSDRHRWFFNFSQAVAFFRGMAELHNLKVIEFFGTEQPRNLIIRSLRRLFYQGDAYANRYVQTVWVVFERKSSSA